MMRMITSVNVILIDLSRSHLEIGLACWRWLRPSPILLILEFLLEVLEHPLKGLRLLLNQLLSCLEPLLSCL